MIFLAFLLVRHAMTIGELSEWTGLSDDAIRPAVKSLAAKGLLFKQTGEHGRTTWLLRGETFFGHVFQNPQKADSAALISSSSSYKTQLSSTEEEEQEEEPESAKIGFCLKACDEAGIREPKRSQLSRLEHVTPELISAHVAMAKAEGQGIGTAIFRIEHNWPVSKKFFEPQLTREEMIKQKVARFMRGE